MTLYTKPTLSDYFNDRPSEDGARTEANKIKAATTINELAGPLKAYAEAINTNLASALNTASRIYTGTFERDATSGSGTQSITGVGFQPTVVDLMCFANTTSLAYEISWGFDDGTNKLCIADVHQKTADAYEVSSSYSMRLVTSGTIEYGGYIDSLDSDGFTVTWVETGAFADREITVRYMAYR